METVADTVLDVQPSADVTGTVRVPLLVYEQQKAEQEFDPDAPLPEEATSDPCAPWTLRGAMSAIAGTEELTAWTRQHAAALKRLLADDPPVEAVPESERLLGLDGPGEVGDER